MTWKIISIKPLEIYRVPLKEQDMFRVKINSDPKVYNSALYFLSAPEKLPEHQKELLNKPNPSEAYTLNPDYSDEYQEGQLIAHLQPGWVSYDFRDWYERDLAPLDEEDPHSVSGVTRSALLEEVGLARPCLCESCVDAHDQHRKCHEDQPYTKPCQVLNHSFKSHQKGHHDLCIPTTCPEVAKSHNTDHKLCKSTICQIKDIEEEHKNNNHSVYCDLSTCQTVRQSHNTDHKMCPYYNPDCHMYPWKRLWEGLDQQ